ncbi:MAG: Lpg1974 family pore-forming outer membrane protein [Chlamydiia bacterium]
MMKIKQLGLLFGLIGAITGVQANDEKGNSRKKCHDEMQVQDCKSLCFAGPHLQEDYCLEVMAAAIYEQVAVQASEVALFTSSTTQTGFPVGGVGLEPEETTSWGFKVGLGWKTGYDDWKFAARYTWLKAITEAELVTATGGAYFPTGYVSPVLSSVTGTGTFPSFQSVLPGNYTLLSTLNIYLMRPTLYTALLEVSPYFGIDFTTTRRRQTVTFSNETPTPTTYTNGGYFRSYDNNSWWGVGPMAGFASNWYVGYDIGVYSDTYIALTYGQAKSYSQTLVNRLVSAGVFSTTDSTISNSVYQFSPELNFQLGLSWMHALEDEKGAIGFKLGYETAYYFQVNKRLFNQPGYFLTTGSGIGTQGLVLQGQIDF